MAQDPATKLNLPNTATAGYQDQYKTVYAIMGDGRRKRIGPRPVDIKRKERQLRREQKALGIVDA